MKKILYLEVFDTNRYLMDTIIKMMSVEIEIISLSKIQEIENELCRTKFDLVISNTYCIDGETIVRNLLAGKYGSLNIKVPTLAYTVVCFDHEKEKCLAAGFKEYLLMPSGGEVLKEKIKKLLEE